MTTSTFTALSLDQLSTVSGGAGAVKDTGVQYEAAGTTCTPDNRGFLGRAFNISSGGPVCTAHPKRVILTAPAGEVQGSQHGFTKAAAPLIGNGMANVMGLYDNAPTP